MKNILRNAFRQSAIATAIATSFVGVGIYLAAPKPANAFFCSNCATFYQQMFEYAKAVETALNTSNQLKTQIKQYDDMIKQGMSLPSSMYGSITGDMQKIANVYQGTQTLGRNISNLEVNFKQQFPGYQSYLQSSGKASEMMPNRYESWSTQGQDNARTAMQSAGMNISTFAAEDARLGAMVSRSQTAEGRLQAIQAGNEIAASNVQQLQKLRDLLATQIQLQSNYMAKEEERLALDNAIRQQRRSKEVNDTKLNKEY